MTGAALSVVRTPDDCFTALRGYPFPPTYADVVAEGLAPVRMHYVDAGPADGPVALLLHGQPTWSYLYRHVIAVLVESGVRVIAPDNIGFGRSDKPTDATDYTFARHIEWMRSLVVDLDGFPAPAARSTARSPGPDTSCRRTPATGSAGRSPRSSAAPSSLAR